MQFCRVEEIAKKCEISKFEEILESGGRCDCFAVSFDVLQFVRFISEMPENNCNYGRGLGDCTCEISEDLNDIYYLNFVGENVECESESLPPPSFLRRYFSLNKFFNLLKMLRNV